MYALNLLAWAGAAISWCGALRYMLEIRAGNTKPRLASWIAWGTANSVLMVVALLNDNWTAAIFNGLAALSNLCVLVLCAVYRVGQQPDNSTDWACLTAAGLCLLMIVSFPHATYLDAILAMAANLIATWPTIQHAWRRPQEEVWQFFAANVAANALGLVSVIAAAGVNLGNIAGPLISMLGNVALVSITTGRGWLMRSVETVETELLGLEEELPQTVSAPEGSA